MPAFSLPSPVVPRTVLQASALTSGVLLVGSFCLLLAGAEVFTNGVEWLGHRLGVSESATGSVLAAVGTALPETMIPVIAIVQGLTTGDSSAANEVGVGAILGAPFLLSTVGMALVGASVLYFAADRTHGPTLQFDMQGTRRDLAYFLVGYTLAVLAALIASRLLSLAIATLLIGLYLVYVYRSLRSGDLPEDDDIDDLLLGRLAVRLGVGGDGQADDPSLAIVIVQTVLALAFIVGGAQLFVTEVEFVSREVLSIPPAVVSLLLAPLATELPEKFNSIIWIANGKDTLAIGNITGAMAFQGTIPATLGIAFTSWNLSPAWGTPGFLNALSAGLALVGGTIVYLRARSAGEADMRARPFLVGAVLYLLFLTIVSYHVFVLGLTGV